MNKKIISLLALSFLTFAGCSTVKEQKKNVATPKAETKQEVVPPKEAKSNKESETITMVWYPNESGNDLESARNEFSMIIEKATGKKVEHKLTTDYSIAIEAIASGKSQIAFMGAQGYIQAKNKSDDILPLMVNSGPTGTLDDAIYHSWLAVGKGKEDQYKNGELFSIDNIVGKKMSFVSNSSTSGFKVPTAGIIEQYKKTDKWKSITTDDLLEGGSDKFFSEVLFGGSHQGSAVNLLTEKSDISAFADTELANYSKVVSGDETKEGSIYEISQDAAEPFNTLVGKQYVVIKSTPVLNGPFAYNSKTLSEEDVEKIQAIFTSEEVANNNQIFVPKDTGFKGFYKKTSNERFLVVEDSWFDPIRSLSN